MNKKKVSTLVLAGLISVQTLVPAMVTFADEVEKINVENGQLQDNQDNQEQNQGLEKYGDDKERDKYEVDNSKTKDIEKVLEREIEYATIPDMNLRKQINNALGYGESENQVSLTDIDKITNLDIQGKNIQSLVGLEHAKNLTSLNLSNNNISDISPLSGLSNLTNLNLSSNNISDISRLNWKIQVLNLSNNHISDISRLAYLTLSTNIILDNNHINDIRALQKLDLRTRYISISNQTIKGIELVDNNNVVDNIVRIRNGNLLRPDTSKEYSYDGWSKITFNDITGRDTVNYSFNYAEMYAGQTEIKLKFSGIVTHKVAHNDVVEAELNAEKGGIMFSTVGLGLRLFISLKNVDSSEIATYYITTSKDESESPKFEVKSTVLNKDYSQIKTSIDFSELSKLEQDVNTKLYVKRVVEGKDPTYTEIKLGDYDLTNGFNISNDNISISVIKNNENVVQLNKSTRKSNSLVQEVSNIYWNSTGMVIEGIITKNGSLDVFDDFKVSMLFKDENGNYIKADDTDKNLEFRGMYKDGKYKITIPYNLLQNVKSFELKFMGSNIQSTDILTKGTVQEFKIGMNDNKLYKLSLGSRNEVNLKIEDLSEISSNLSSVKVTTDKSTGIRQFSITGNVNIMGMDKIDSNVKYTIVGKKEGKVVFEQLATKINNNGNYNGFKTNLSVSELKKAKLSQGEKISLELKIEYLGNTIIIDLNSNQLTESITDKESKETFEISSEDGKVIVSKK